MLDLLVVGADGRARCLRRDNAREPLVHDHAHCRGPGAYSLLLTSETLTTQLGPGSQAGRTKVNKILVLCVRKGQENSGPLPRRKEPPRGQAADRFLCT